MAVLEDVVLVADGGDITVGRRGMPFVYGEFNVVLPDGVQQKEGLRDERLQDGYVYRPEGAVRGPFDVGFVRADVTIDLEADTSDLEVVVDAAQKQSEGDVFFERDISRAGLGRFVLDQDFEVGDVVAVELWGKQLLVPVTAGDYVASAAEGPSGVRVHVGGQLISDAEAVVRRNQDLARQVAREKAERARQVSSARSHASLVARSEASSAEVRAKADADAKVAGEKEAREAADRNLQGQIDKRPTQEKLNDEIRAVNETLSKNYVASGELNNRLEGITAAFADRYVAQSELVGELGPLSTQLKKLNNYLTPEKQREINALQGQVNATNTRLWGEQGELNKLNADFQQEQGRINSLNDEFKKQQRDINAHQVEINALDGRFQVEQNQRNLLTEYTVAYNRIMAEAFRPIRATIHGPLYNFEGAVLAEAVVPQELDGVFGETATFQRLDSGGRLLVPLRDGVLLSAVLEVEVRRFDGSRVVKRVKSYGFVSSGLDYRLTVGVDAEQTAILRPGGAFGYWLSGLVFPRELLPFYQRKLDDLRLQFRGRGLNV